MNIALKEWAVVVEALARGRQIFLLRKGGIAESKRGFELKHRRFLFFPTWEHQQRDWIRPAYRELFDSLQPADPDRLLIRRGAQVDDVLRAPAGLSLLLDSPEHVWAEPYLRMRYDYRPDLPLCLVVVRSFTLPEPVSLPHDRRYKGCRSWVELYQDVADSAAAPDLSDSAFQQAKQRLLASIKES